MGKGVTNTKSYLFHIALLWQHHNFHKLIRVSLAGSDIWGLRDNRRQIDLSLDAGTALYYKSEKTPKLPHSESYNFNHKVILAITTQNSQQNVFGFCWHSSHNQLTLSNNWQAFSHSFFHRNLTGPKEEQGRKKAGGQRLRYLL